MSPESPHDITEAQSLHRRLLLIVADGVRPDVMQEEMDAGNTPTLQRLRERGGLHAVSSSFPSVTGPAYVPFLMGRHPANVGLPGLRWYDRARSLRWSPYQARSYAGIDIWHIDGDVTATAPTLLELATPSLAGMSMIGRGATHGRIGRSVYWMCRASPAHFRGDLHGWQRVEREASASFLKRFARVRPRFSVLAITSPDKFAHKFGCRSAAVRSAIGDVDAAAAQAFALAERDGWGDALHVWVVGDHGHAPVSQHDDLHGWLEREGLRVLAHPQLGTRRPDVALMVGGNAMAHLYLAPAERTRRWWGELAPRWSGLADRLLQRASVDLLMVAHSAHDVEVRHATRGSAHVHLHEDGHGDRATTRWTYEPTSGDPLCLGGRHDRLDLQAAWEVTQASPYPDAVVQLSWLAISSRAGDCIVSAAPDWDLRARFEPVEHVSTHGALLRDQMLVPLLIDTPPAQLPQRTTDVVPSALQLLGVAADTPYDGRSFLT
ncbi:MAG: alkaline phosphatase family protein [Gemmatimonadaceae bacterium]|nr:alkaline phosphatase family protein [Gemmatimonadaceae bacterium]